MNHVRISVIIPAYNEEKLLGECLKSLQKQTFPRDQYEVIVVDNGSTDRTFQIAKELGVTVSYYTDKKGAAAARHHGTEKAQGKILAFTDADSQVESDWLETIAVTLQNPKYCCIFGPVFPLHANRVQNALFSFYDWFLKTHQIFGKALPWGLNMAILKDAYTAVGGFQVFLKTSEDWDLGLRLQKHFGKKAVSYVSDLRVYTTVRKLQDSSIFSRYITDGIRNYINVVILGKTKSSQMINLR